MQTIPNFVKYPNITNSIVVDPSFQGVNKPVLSFSECDGQKHLQWMLTYKNRNKYDKRNDRRKKFLWPAIKNIGKNIWESK